MKQSGSKEGASKMERQVVWLSVFGSRLRLLPSQRAQRRTMEPRNAWWRGRCSPSSRQWWQGWAGGRGWPGAAGAPGGCCRWRRAGPWMSRCRCEGQWVVHGDPRGLDSPSRNGGGDVTSLPLRGCVVLSRVQRDREKNIFIISYHNTPRNRTKQTSRTSWQVWHARFTLDISISANKHVL